MPFRLPSPRPPASTRVVASLVAAMVLCTACGTAGTASAVRVPRRQAATPPPAALPPAPGPSPAGDPASLLAAFRARVAAARALRAEVQVASRGAWYGGRRTASERSSRSSSRMTWAAPDRLRADVVESSTAFLAGAALVWDGRARVKVKAAGPLGLVPLAIGLGDERLLTNRNHAFADDHPMAHFRRLAGPDVTWSAAPPRDEAPGAAWVEARGMAPADPGVTRELLAIEPSSLAPAAIVMFEGPRVVVTFRFSGFRWDPDLDAAIFRL